MGSSGLFFEAHVGLGRGFVAFFEVAFAAAGDEVFPGVGSSDPSGDDVVDGEVPGRTAILALVVVAGEDGVSGEAESGDGSSDLVSHSDDAGDSDLSGACSDYGFGVVEDFGFSEDDEGERPGDIADIEGLVVGVEQEDVVLRHF